MLSYQLCDNTASHTHKYYSHILFTAVPKEGAVSKISRGLHKMSSTESLQTAKTTLQPSSWRQQVTAYCREVDSRVVQYGVEGSTEFQLPTHHLSILLTPGSGEGVSTDCTPHPIVTHLHLSCIGLCYGSCLNESYITFLVSGAGQLSCRGLKKIKLMLL